MICAKQVYLTSRKLEDSPYPIIELLLPINTFWEVESDLKQIEYLIASNEESVIIQDRTVNLFRKMEPFAVSERDRIYLRGRFGGNFTFGTKSG